MTQLHLNSVIGIDGDITDGCILHPDGETLIYSLGSTIVFRQKDSIEHQSFLRGPTNKVSCLAISSSGRYIASGHLTHMGFNAEIYLWDFQTRSQLHRMELHKAKVEALSFSNDEKFLISLGGQDDNALVLWDVNTGSAVCGSPTDGSSTSCIKFLNKTNSTFVTGGDGSLKFWDYDAQNNKLKATNISLGQLRRIINCLFIDKSDECLYCGTTTGDILQVNITARRLQRTGPTKSLISGGVTSLIDVGNNDMLIGSGDGTIRCLTFPKANTQNKFMKPIRELAAVHLTSRTHRGNYAKISSMSIECVSETSVTLLVATKMCEIHRVHYTISTHSLSADLLQTCNFGCINDLAFPCTYGAIFATCGLGDIRLWHLKTSRELLRILVPNIECHCVSFSRDGSFIFSGWSDGAIRVFKPQSGVLECKRSDAHHKSVMSIACAKHDNRVITGDEDGTIRVWRLIERRIELIASLKEHKSSVTSIKINEALDDECASCSEDGSCVIWDLNTFQRRNSLFANTCLRAIEYHPDGSQLITGGTDRKITYWDPFDGQAIRVIDGSDSHPLNTLAIDVDGQFIVSGGEDSILKCWNYDEGICSHTGIAHSGHITRLEVSPDRCAIVSVGNEGGIYIWSYPNFSPK